MMTTKKDEERREAFRVNDSLPLIIRKIGEELAAVPLDKDIEIPEDLSAADLAKENLSPYLWKMLTGLNKKLEDILERLPDDILTARSRPVNLSPTGMRFQIKRNLHLDQRVRIKILLPTSPVKEIILDGKVVRVKALSDGNNEVALHFLELNEEIKNAILQYTLNRQRQDIINKRIKKGGDESA
ncbi:MAG: PilZ domain-containing protein [Thermodesulfobacteriota bacterium]